jgi:HSP20 family protein
VEKAKRKYHRIIDLPSETDVETARSTYSNGILEIIFDKQSKPRGREIKVD